VHFFLIKQFLKGLNEAAQKKMNLFSFPQETSQSKASEKMIFQKCHQEEH
tara:strand:- start:1114 stop:1263 length:150 start_codon:yes stop_codon:yes gene_type:complete